MQLWKDCRMMAAFPETFFWGGGRCVQRMWWHCTWLGQTVSEQLFSSPKFIPCGNYHPLCVCVSFFLLLLCYTHTQTHANPPTPLRPVFPFCSLLFFCSLSLLLVSALLYPPPPFASLSSFHVTKNKRSSWTSTLIRRQKNQWNRNSFHVLEVRRNRKNLVFVSVLPRETDSKWAATMYSQDRYRTIWKESWRATNEKTKVQKITCLELINGRTKNGPWSVNHSCSTSSPMLPPALTPTPCSETWREVPEAPPQNASWSFSPLDPPEGQEGRPDRGLEKQASHRGSQGKGCTPTLWANNFTPGCLLKRNDNTCL